MNKVSVFFRAPVLTQSGYGVVSRQIFEYLINDDRFEVFCDATNWGKTPHIHNWKLQQKAYECIAKLQHLRAQHNGQDPQYDISICHTIPNEFERKGQVNIGVTAGIEVDRVTKEWIEKANQMDMIIVPSQHSKEVFEKTEFTWRNKENGQEGILKLVKPIFIVPHWFEEPAEDTKLKLDFQTNTNLLFVGLWGPGGFGEDRKNVADLVRLFYETYHKKDESVGLVLKVSRGQDNEEDFKATVEGINQIKQNFGNPKHCKVYLIHDTLSDEQMWALYKHPKISAYVTLSHGEGFGLPTLEAHAAGLPVVALNWSGHKDFLREGKGFLPIEFGFAEVPEAAVWPGVIDKGSRWAKAKDEVIQKAIRKIVRDHKKYRSSVDKQWLLENFGKERGLKYWGEIFSKFLFEETPDDVPVQARQQASEKERAASELSALLNPDDKERVLYIMPRSAGDVLLSTAIVSSLIKERHFDVPFYFATSEEYRPLLKSLEETFENFKVIPYKDLMMHSELTSEVWDFVYNPGVNVQYNFSNWLLGNGDYSVRLVEEFAKNCNLHPRELGNYMVPEGTCDLEPKTYVTFSPAGSKSAKDYGNWEDVLENVKKMLPGVKIVQTGLSSEKRYHGDDILDWRGKSYEDTISLIKGAMFHIGVDTLTAHIAAAVETPHVAVYGSTSPHAVTPVVLANRKSALPQYLIDSPTRAELHGCKNPCYKDVCLKPKNGQNCMTTGISAEVVCNTIYGLIQKLDGEKE